MRLKKVIKALVFVVFCAVSIGNSVISCADVGESGLPVPRFVSLGHDESNVRTGPGEHYPVKWVLRRKGLPIEVILEYDNWRKIKDPEGQEGWVFHTLLSGERTAIINAQEAVYAYERPFNEQVSSSRAVIALEPSVIVDVDSCSGQWCKVDASGFSGWIQRKLLWGVYEHENID